MSYSALIPMDEFGRHREWVELRNSWGTAAFIWDKVQAHLGWRNDWYETNDRAAMSWLQQEDKSPLWGLHANAEIPPEDRIALAFTFDRVWVPREHKGTVADALRRFHEKYVGDGWSHLPAIADAIESIDADAFGLYATSVGENPWQKWREDVDDMEVIVIPKPENRIDVLLPDLFAA